MLKDASDLFPLLYLLAFLKHVFKSQIRGRKLLTGLGRLQLRDLQNAPAIQHSGKNGRIGGSITIAGGMVLFTGAIVNGPRANPTFQIWTGGIQEQQFLPDHIKCSSAVCFASAQEVWNLCTKKNGPNPAISAQTGK
jgi:hypothetical protein